MGRLPQLQRQQQATDIVDTQTLVTEEIQMLQVVLYLRGKLKKMKNKS
jgi:hypothetical protein